MKRMTVTLGRYRRIHGFKDTDQKMARAVCGLPFPTSAMEAPTEDDKAPRCGDCRKAGAV